MCIYIYILYVYGVYLYLPYIYIYKYTHIYICIKYTQYTSRSKRLKSELLLRGHFVFLSFRLHKRTPGYWHRGFRSSWRPLRGALSWRTGQSPGVQERTGEHQGFFAKSTCTYLHLQHSSKENSTAVFSRPVTRTVGYGLVLVPNGFMAPTLQESTSQRSHMPHAQRATQTQRTSCPLNLGLQCHQLGVAAGADLFASKKHIMWALDNMNIWNL